MTNPVVCCPLNSMVTIMSIFSNAFAEEKERASQFFGGFETEARTHFEQNQGDIVGKSWAANSCPVYNLLACYGFRIISVDRTRVSFNGFSLVSESSEVKDTLSESDGLTPKPNEEEVGLDLALQFALELDSRYGCKHHPVEITGEQALEVLNQMSAV